MTEKPIRQITIKINGSDVVLDDGEYTGAELKERGHVPAGETLFLKHGNGPEEEIEDTRSVKIHPNMVFESSPPGGVSDGQ
jgi:hypothetical protein